MEVKVSKEMYKEFNKNCNKTIMLLDNVMQLIKKNYKKVSTIK